MTALLTGFAPTPSRHAGTRTRPVLLACSHGTSSSAGQLAVAGLVLAVAARRPDLDVRSSFVDVQEPDVPSTLASIGSRAVNVVPLLLSAGYHVHVDLAEAAADAHDAAVRPALGPDLRLAGQLVRRLDEAGVQPSDAVVLAAAGSSDRRAVEHCEAMGRMLAELLGRDVTVGYISAVEPALGDAVETARRTAPGRRVAVATYLLAPGYFADLAAASGADVVSAPLLLADEPAPPELAELVLDRFEG